MEAFDASVYAAKTLYDAGAKFVFKSGACLIYHVAIYQHPMQQITLYSLPNGYCMRLPKVPIMVFLLQSHSLL
jgi:hypothetical protein